MKNYTLTDSRFIRDLKCEVRIYSHDKTGARVVFMPADDDNRAVSIAFSTPAENDKGIPHIIIFGPDGTIYSRGLTGEDLALKLNSYLKF